ncbi:LLM class flavin-dependent oxidoreductase [Brachybacterium vulturis]|uniref:LLM class flavin-dependent oxidoreductase n=1 Tax=Brachybacterium vulturis TaxID=2017484 RepID=A0A291GPI7_9MICO|nr:LLM class flavin-dependent oxidoreductase [Brachybacterium vulturis]ATG51884.1 LLM class flavin-dependent oxidoreductase [Brachybacterium vulturis]
MTARTPGLREAPRIGFVAQIEHTGIRSEGGTVTSDGLEQGIELFLAAEDLGYDVGYVRTRHLQDTLSSPLLFLAALGRRTARIELGTAVIPLRFENAGRLAEDLATADLLTGGRLRPGVSSGHSAHEAMYTRAFGAVPERAEHVDRVLHDLVSLLDGEIVAGADRHVEELAAGSPLRLQPQVPGLRDRLAYGAADPRRAARAGALGLRLQLATMAPDDGSGRPFAELQLEALEAYRSASREAGHGEGHVMVSRQMIPVRSDAELERYLTLLPRERAPEARIVGEHRGREIGGHEAVFSEVVLDQPAAVARALWEDPVVRAADEIVLVLPLGASLREQQDLLRTFGALVVPPLQMVLSRGGGAAG